MFQSGVRLKIARSVVHMYPGDIPVEGFDAIKKQMLEMVKLVKSVDNDNNVDIKIPVNNDDEVVIIFTANKM
jgi:hypothetical protein